ncbi:MAG: helix-turn-helix transcriptional regulator [Oscillospiraceae bacterium]|nr:helix-turn-helix transcriptional regulator [Oscillospiraceae bacterium]
MNLSAFSETLSRLRRERGLTQAELGARLGISKSAVSMYECGKREPELDLLRAMADLFGVSESVLLGRPESELVNADPELTEYLQQLRDRPELRMLFSLTKNATKQDVEAAVRIIEALRAPDADT